MNFSENAGRSIGEALIYNNCLQNLNLFNKDMFINFNGLNNNSAVSIGKALEQNYTLKILNLGIFL